jgi:RNase adaptor protein for sRNA GlmZ degradation
MKNAVSDTRQLLVSIFSFGYTRSGIPGDPNGNGGGYVFDCRFLPNPAWDPKFMPLSGLDDEVRQHLDDSPEVREFLLHVFEIVDATAAGYLERGFTVLQVAFGCTGGQHRSVYCAEQLARHLRRKKVRVEVTHTERGKWW